VDLLVETSVSEKHIISIFRTEGANGAMPLRAKHQSEADLARAENGFPKPLWDRHRTSSLGSRAPEHKPWRPGPNEASILVNDIDGKASGVK
jgi:hypothetical protein